jgi:hypothetical protein
VRVLYSEGVATHAGPESCAVGREAGGEALTGERAGRPLSRERFLVLGADAVGLAEGNTDGRVTASARTARRGLRPRHARTLLAREPGDLPPDHRPGGPSGPHREDDESKPMMHGREKSDLAIVAMKPANKGGRPSAEPVEPRAGAEGNAGQADTHRTPSRASVPPELGDAAAGSTGQARPMAGCGRGGIEQAGTADFALHDTRLRPSPREEEVGSIREAYRQTGPTASFRSLFVLEGATTREPFDATALPSNAWALRAI